MSPFEEFIPLKKRTPWGKLNQWLLLKLLVKYHIFPGVGYWHASAFTIWNEMQKVRKHSTKINWRNDKSFLMGKPLKFNDSQRKEPHNE